jgi:hypothetical protein
MPTVNVKKKSHVYEMYFIACSLTSVIGIKEASLLGGKGGMQCVNSMKVETSHNRRRGRYRSM